MTILLENGYRRCTDCGRLWSANGSAADVMAHRCEDVDPVNHPPHYNGHPSGVECITITEHMNFCIGSAMKYLWRAGRKGPALEDLKKARWYVDREIQRLERP